MPFETITVPIVRKQMTRTKTAGRKPEEFPIEGSPFLCRVHRRKQRTTGNQEEATNGTANIEAEQYLAVLSPRADIKANDTAILPPCIFTNGKEVRAYITRVRPYEQNIQCDFETGARQGKTGAQLGVAE